MNIDWLQKHIEKLTKEFDGKLTNISVDKMTSPLPDPIHEDTMTYLSHLMTTKGFQIRRGGFGLVGMDDLLNVPFYLPGETIVPYGFLPIGFSIGGNSVILDTVLGEVLWADHETFWGSDTFTCPPPFEEYLADTGEWKEMPGGSRENVRKGMFLLEKNIETFLKRCICDDVEFLERLYKIA